MKKLLFSTIALVSAIWFVGCSKGGGGSDTVIPTCTYVNGVCNNGGITYPGTTTQVRYYDYKFFFDLSNPYSPYNGVPGGLTITNTGAYQAFLKEAMAVCDNYSYNTGASACSTWAQGSLQVQFTVDASMVPQIYFAAVPGSSSTWYNLYAGIPTGGVTMNPLMLTTGTTFSLINNSTGFEIRSQGSSLNAGGLKLIQIQVNQGTLGQNNLSYKLFYPYNGVATLFATGTFKLF